MLKIKRSHRRGKEEYILYNPDNFTDHHTHTRSLRIALKIKYNVENRIIPISDSAFMIESHIRVATNNSKYKKQLINLYIGLGGKHKY